MMNPLNDFTVLEKSSYARQILQTRANREISLRLRSVMLLLNGERTLAEVKTLLSTWDDVEAICQQLMSLGLATIKSNPVKHSNEAVPIGRRTEIIRSHLMTEARHIFGDHAKPLLNILEQAPSNNESLAAALAECKQYATMFIDEQRAQAFVQSAKSIRYWQKNQAA